MIGGAQLVVAGGGNALERSKFVSCSPCRAPFSADLQLPGRLAGLEGDWLRTGSRLSTIEKLPAVRCFVSVLKALVDNDMIQGLSQKST